MFWLLVGLSRRAGRHSFVACSNRLPYSLPHNLHPVSISSRPDWKITPINGRIQIANRKCENFVWCTRLCDWKILVPRKADSGPRSLKILAFKLMSRTQGNWKDEFGMRAKAEATRSSFKAFKKITFGEQVIERGPFSAADWNTLWPGTTSWGTEQTETSLRKDQSVSISAFTETWLT